MNTKYRRSSIYLTLGAPAQKTLFKYIALLTFLISLDRILFIQEIQ